MSKLTKPRLTVEQKIALLDAAENAKKNTYPEPGGYSVALLTDKGNIYKGVSYKSDTLTLTMHSEATALANAAINGEKSVIAITGPNCHICKQLIWESALNSGIDIQIIMKDKESIDQVSISDLMQYPWPDEDGNK